MKPSYTYQGSYRLKVEDPAGKASYWPGYYLTFKFQCDDTAYTLTEPVDLPTTIELNKD